MINREIDHAATATKYERFKLLAIAREITTGHAVIGCLLYPTNVNEPIEVMHDQSRAEAKFKGVQTCKSVWACPVCSDRISRYRAAELLRGMETWVKGGNRVAMATYTLSHRASESCRDVLDRLKAAYDRFKGDRAGKKSLKQWGYAGGVRVMEVTYGANGWHWHIHEIYFLRGAVKRRHAAMKAALSAHWQHVVAAVGGNAIAKGYQLDNESAAAFDYVSRYGSVKAEKGWSLALEVTRSPAKLREGAPGLHPFQILASADRKDAANDRRTWQEYVTATKGVRHIVYSRGLKDLLGLAEVEDAAIVAEPESGTLPVIARITSRGWYYLNRKETNLFPEFKRVADTGDADLLASWLDQYDIETDIRYS